MSDDRVEFVGMEDVAMPCHSCGEPVHVMAEDPDFFKDQVRKGRIVPWCHGCAMAVEAESITAAAVEGGPK